MPCNAPYNALNNLLNNLQSQFLHYNTYPLIVTLCIWNSVILIYKKIYNTHYEYIQCIIPFDNPSVFLLFVLCFRCWVLWLSVKYNQTYKHLLTHYARYLLYTGSINHFYWRIKWESHCSVPLALFGYCIIKSTSHLIQFSSSGANGLWKQLDLYLDKVDGAALVFSFWSVKLFIHTFLRSFH